MEVLERKIKLIPLEEIEPFIKIAEKTCPDKKDAHYFALALKLNCGIWSNDKQLKSQDKVKIYSTGDILHILKNKY